jgi:serine/threonine protein kinase
MEDKRNASECRGNRIVTDSKIIRRATRAHDRSSHPSALATGTQVGPFVIEDVLGSGGFGITYRATHQTLRKSFALKEYFPHQFSYRDTTNVRASPSAAMDYAWGLDRFEKEAQALAKFKHPSIVDVSDIFAANETAYMVLAYEPGDNLGHWLQDLGRPMDQHELDRIVAPLLDALELVHAHKILHRDIAPDNILIRPDGTPVLIDFGAARDDLQHRAGPVTAVIKPGYSPPEQYQSEPSLQGPWTDIYGFGATLYYAVVGALPVRSQDRFDAQPRTAAVEKAHGFYRTSFLAAIDWALKQDPAGRPRSVGEWRARLLEELPEIPAGDLATKTIGTISPVANRKLQSIVAGTALAAALALPTLIWPCRTLGVACEGHATNPSATAALKIEIALPKQSFAIGDNLTFKVRTNKDCYFMVYTVSPTDEVERHDPRENSIFMGSSMLKADEWRQLPVQGFATVKPPVGNFELGAVCSKEPLTNIGLSNAQLSEPTRGGRRSFSFALDNAAKAVRRDDLARTTVGYEVRQ